VIVTAGEPLGQSRRVAIEAMQAGHRVVYCPDMSVGRIIGGVDTFISGVESFYADGSLANTADTLMLSLLSWEHAVQVVAPAEPLKYDPRRTTVNLTRLAGRLLVANKYERWLPAEQPWTLEDHVLDAVPYSMITKYITDEGAQMPSAVGAYSRPVLARWIQPQPWRATTQ